MGGQITIEVRDDGRGLDPEKIRRKALQQGLRTKEELARLGPRDLLALILLPGFSTAAEVTDVSGRGVGMDVVKTNLDRLGGVLEIESEPGRGTTFTLRLPLTLAIIPCLIVVVGGERYALPQKDLEELVCLHPGQSPMRVETTFDQEVVRRRDRLLPLVRLAEVLRRPTPFTAATWAEVLRKQRDQGSAVRGREPEASSPTLEPSPLTPLYFAVVKVGSRRFGLVVDDILATEEIVVKPMHAAVKPLACFSGATILGDGRVTLILNVEGVARHAGVRFDSAERAVDSAARTGRPKRRRCCCSAAAPASSSARRSHRSAASSASTWTASSASAIGSFSPWTACRPPCCGWIACCRFRRARTKRKCSCCCRSGRGNRWACCCRS